MNNSSLAASRMAQKEVFPVESCCARAAKGYATSRKESVSPEESFADLLVVSTAAITYLAVLTLLVKLVSFTVIAWIVVFLLTVRAPV